MSAIKYSPCIFKFRFQIQTDLLTYILYPAGKLVTNFISVDFRYLCRSIIFCLLYLCTFQAACSWHVHHKRIHRTRNNRLLTRHHTETRASVLQVPFEILEKMLSLRRKFFKISIPLFPHVSISGETTTSKCIFCNSFLLPCKLMNVAGYSNDSPKFYYDFTWISK